MRSRNGKNRNARSRDGKTGIRGVGMGKQECEE